MSGDDEHADWKALYEAEKRAHEEYQEKVKKFLEAFAGAYSLLKPKDKAKLDPALDQVIPRYEFQMMQLGNID